SHGGTSSPEGVLTGSVPPGLGSIGIPCGVPARPARHDDGPGLREEAGAYSTKTPGPVPPPWPHPDRPNSRRSPRPSGHFRGDLSTPPGVQGRPPGRDGRPPGAPGPPAGEPSGRGTSTAP